MKILSGRGVDLTLLNLGLSDLNGLDFLRRLRRSDRILPVFVLRSWEDDWDVVRALDLGADDVLTKPFRFDELLARSRALLRRVSPPAPSSPPVHDLVIDGRRRIAFRGGNPLDLSGMELDLLAALMSAPGEILDRGDLLVRAGRGATRVGERAVDVHISRLRKKVEVDPRRPSLIKTVHGRGYVFTGYLGPREDTPHPDAHSALEEPRTLPRIEG